MASCQKGKFTDVPRNDTDKTQKGLLKLAARMFEHGAEAMRKAQKAWERGDGEREKRFLEKKDFLLGLYQTLKKQATSCVA